MRVDINTPEISALRSDVEQKFGCSLRAPRHFVALSSDIEEAIKKYLSETTLQRVWQYKAGYLTIAIHTLNVLCQYIGVSDWETYCNCLKDSSINESSMSKNRGIDIESLKVGTKIRIGWLPDRTCIIKYLGNYRFEAIETHNSKLIVGDTFSCVFMQVGREMCLDRLVRGDSNMNYIIGNRNGLKTLEIIED